MQNLITHKYLVVAPDFQFSNCVFKSQNTLQNVSVSHKIENESVSQEIVIYRVFLRGQI